MTRIMIQTTQHVQTQMRLMNLSGMSKFSTTSLKKISIGQTISKNQRLIEWNSSILDS